MKVQSHESERILLVAKGRSAGYWGVRFRQRGYR